METDAFARKTDPGTSVDAAVSVHQTDLEKRVLGYIRSFGGNGCICSELEHFSGIPYQTLTPRFRPLERKGLIIRPGRKKVGNSGRRQLVMIASEFFSAKVSEVRRLNR